MFTNDVKVINGINFAIEDFVEIGRTDISAELINLREATDVYGITNAMKAVKNLMSDISDTYLTVSVALTFEAIQAILNEWLDEALGVYDTSDTHDELIPEDVYLDELPPNTDGRDIFDRWCS